jgi:membrane fusion protein, multidrug efflux system
MKIKYIVYSLIILIVGYLVFTRLTQDKPVAANMGKGGKMPPMMVNGMIIKPQNFNNSLQISGSIEANEQVQIRSEISGIIENISFREGSSVSKGEVLIRINDDELQAQLTQAVTKENLSKENEYRAKALLEKEAISQQEYDVALADLKSLQAQTQLIRAQLSKTVIRAPFSGHIGLRTISVGEYVNPTIAITNLVNANPVKISFSIPEKYSNRVRSGSEISFRIDGSDKKNTAKIYAIEPGINATTRTLQMKAYAENPKGDLLPGSFAKIDLPLSTVNDALLVPTQAVIPVLKGKKVFIANNGTAKEVMIETSTRTDKDVLVTSGLNANDTVLTTGMMSLRDGAPVKVKVVNE